MNNNSNKKNDDIYLKPSNPDIAYKNKGWTNWGEFLGTNTIAAMNKDFLSFERARNFVRSLNLKSQKEWFNYCKSGKKPENIPTSPMTTYKEQFRGIKDWLGIGLALKYRVYLSFEKAKKIVKKLGLKNIKEWKGYCKSGKKPDNIPVRPYYVYKNKWISWGDWLGTGRIAPSKREYRSFKEARKFAIKLKLKSIKEWKTYCKYGKKPIDIPFKPERTYSEEWDGYGDWLGTKIIATFNMEYKPFEEARKFVRKLKLKGQREWRIYCKSGKKPNDIPSSPAVVYKEEWDGEGDWLGTGNVASFNKKFLSFKKAKKFAKKLKLKSQNLWCLYCKSGKKPKNIPSSPNRTYKKEWEGWGDWLGTGNIANFNKKYRPFKEARKFAMKLKLKNKNQWTTHCKFNDKPSDIPKRPDHVYKNRLKGWEGWKNFLGNK